MPQGTVLVVDDDEAIRELVREVLASEGYDVREAADGAAALAVLAATVPCVILLDMNMPWMDGWAFAREYRARDGVALVCMTAAADAPQRARAIAAEGLLGKPFELDDLFAVVARFCSASGVR